MSTYGFGCYEKNLHIIFESRKCADFFVAPIIQITLFSMTKAPQS